MTTPRQTVADIVDTLTRDLADPATIFTEHNHHPPVPQSLANGAAGIVLLHAERARTGHGDPSTVHAWLAAATNASVEAGPQASLFFGVPALAYVIHTTAEGAATYQHARATLHAATTALTRDRLNQAHTRIDRGERPTLAEFDLIRGLTGLGAYHLRVDPHHKITADVLDYLVRLTEPLPNSGDLPGWWTDLAPNGRPSPHFPHGHSNHGLAHGIAGPLTVLSLALRHGVVVDEHHQAISRICTWLDAWQRDHPAGPWWPRTITLNEAQAGRCDQPGPLQPSWCYGTPGIARAQQLAAITTGDTARQHTAETAILGCATDPAQLARIIDPSLCHGAAGLLHTTWRAASDAATSELNACLPHLTALLVERLETAPRNSELLEGSTGAALALHTAATGTTRSGWDSCLLLA
ncbi:lanthionine synthetase C family protein [Kibdelosporangium phytohabitans]|uniref:Lanthionine synthetase n=1 Tax=Kibdelosporangium phytohabitans TaxID=860235 RepID=A0A0N9HTW6_9PSEU|nr:lanthionine synthetase C family protein [Kibdelosporangium phytohabitans]ALG06354.1 hypothetical protein AOZ06_04935 [Kibdelosporangium phytohabitans]MBE1467493.1 hypothetical protein [Kibdelosporangium phytohabitans]